ncbi:MAG: thioredoxin family protein [Bacillota bacterium]|nr:thioredoxin family protein [Bacillota bacterium]
MSLFKKKPCCNIDAAKIEKANNEKSTGAKVKILGGGCAKCNQLEANTLKALEQLGLDTTIDHVKDFSQIASYGVMTTPAIVYNGKVLSYGKVLSADEIAALIKAQ